MSLSALIVKKSLPPQFNMSPSTTLYIGLQNVTEQNTSAGFYSNWVNYSYEGAYGKCWRYAQAQNVSANWCGGQPSDSPPYTSWYSIYYSVQAAAWWSLTVNEGGVWTLDIYGTSIVSPYVGVGAMPLTWPNGLSIIVDNDFVNESPNGFCCG